MNFLPPNSTKLHPKETKYSPNMELIRLYNKSKNTIDSYIFCGCDTPPKIMWHSSKENIKKFCPPKDNFCRFEENQITSLMVAKFSSHQNPHCYATITFFLIFQQFLSLNSWKWKQKETFVDSSEGNFPHRYSVFRE